MSGLQNLRPGQLLHASVLSDTSQNLVKLRIGTAELIARTQVALKADQRITLDVIKPGTVPELRIMREPVVREYQSDALRALLPKQITLQRLFANLQALYTTIAKLQSLPGVETKSLNPQTSSAQQSSAAVAGKADVDKGMLQIIQSLTGKPDAQGVASRFGPELMQATRRVLAAAIPDSKSITPSQLRQAILGYGLFLEAQLAAGQPPSSGFKTDLLQLLFQLGAGLKATNPTAVQGNVQPSANSQLESGFSKLLELLFRHAEGGLARIQLNQLASLPADEGARQVWQFEVPIRHQEQVDSFLIRLEQEQSTSKSGDAQQAWHITLRFDLDPLGPVVVQLSLRQEEISALFLAERRESADLFDQHLPTLNSALSQAGLTVGKLAARRGAATIAEPPHRSPMPLLDEKA